MSEETFTAPEADRAVYVVTGRCTPGPATRAEEYEELADLEQDDNPLRAAHRRAFAHKLRRTGKDIPVKHETVFDSPVFFHAAGPYDATAVCPCGHWADFLCDAPLGRGETCDKPLCRCCTSRFGADFDHCAYHEALAAAHQPIVDASREGAGND